MSKLSSKLSHGITLNAGGYTSPLTITNTGGISSVSIALYSASGGTVINSGTIVSTTSYAVEGGVGLVVTNAAGGVVTGYLAGVRAAAATIVNHGTIKETGNGGTAVYLAATGADGAVSNYNLVSAVYTGVLFRGSGSLLNDGTIASSGRFGVLLHNGNASYAIITNNGTISGSNNGVSFLYDGTLNNAGLIVGSNALAVRGAAAIVNSGTVNATYGTGIVLGSGTVSNTSTGLITAAGTYNSVYITTGTATITNAGTIAGYNDIVVASADTASQTVIDTGTIASNSGTAVAFGSGGGRMQFNASASAWVQGTVSGGTGPSTLAFASGASSGTLTGQGAVFTNFGSASVASGAQWTLLGSATIGTGVNLNALGTLTVAGSLAVTGTLSSADHGIRLAGGTIIDSGAIAGTAPIAFGTGSSSGLLIVGTGAAAIAGTISGFTGINDTIDLKGLSDSGNNASTSFNTTTSVLTVTGSSGSVQLHLGGGSYTGTIWKATNDGTNGTDITPVCFLPGTGIATPDGEIPVERLRAGDLVLTASGAARPVVWVGTGRVLAPQGRRGAAAPVIVRKGALGHGLPRRDLHVTKAHSLYLDDVLIPVEFLVNHRTIVWDDRGQEVELYHVELESHDILIANGAPAESYRDDGNRWMFRNAGSGDGLPAQEPYAPVLTGGPVVDAVWRRLLGPVRTFHSTDDPDLHLVVDGVRLDGRRVRADLFVSDLPPRPGRVILASRSGVPSELGFARDGRRLGVAVRRLMVGESWRLEVLNADDPRLTAGFHNYEPSEDLRWTDGAAELPAALFAGSGRPRKLEVYLGGATRYPAEDGDGTMAALA